MTSEQILEKENKSKVMAIQKGIQKSIQKNAQKGMQQGAQRSVQIRNKVCK